MSRRLSIGVMLRPGADGSAADAPAQARLAEHLGFDGVFVGDHLKAAHPSPECLTTLAAAAGATERIRLGAGVMVVAIRDPVWTAKQLASLQHLSGGRVILGVGTGSAADGAEPWDAVGVAYSTRGHVTDETLGLLPALIRGESVHLPSGASIALAPGAEAPPMLIGGNSPSALRRARRHHAGWFPSMVPPHRVLDGAAELPHAPPIAVGCGLLLGAQRTDARVRDFTAALVSAYGIAPADALEVAITGTPPEAAERLAAYTDAGATWLVLGAIDNDRHNQLEQLAEVAALLRRR